MLWRTGSSWFLVVRFICGSCIGTLHSWFSFVVWVDRLRFGAELRVHGEHVTLAFRVDDAGAVLLLWPAARRVAGLSFLRLHHRAAVLSRAAEACGQEAL